MRLLVLGGTVFLSRTVAELAIAQGHDVTVACRGESGPIPEGARHVKVDRDDPATFAPLEGERFDAVVDVARKPSQVKTALAKLSANTGHWTFVSTCNVYADDSVPGQRVDTAALKEPTAADADENDAELYGALKVACENAIREVRGDDAFIVRAGLIGGPYDASDRFTYWPLRLARGGEVIVPGPEDATVQVVDARDLAGWIIDAATEGTTGTFDGLGKTMPFEQFLAEVGAGVESKSTLTWVEPKFLTDKGVGFWMGERTLPMWLPEPEYAGFMARDGSPSFEAGLKPRPISDTARDTLAWATGKGHTPVRAGIPEADEAELLAAWHAESR